MPPSTSNGSPSGAVAQAEARTFLPFKAQRAVFESSALKAGERLVLLALIFHADKDGVCFPSVGRIAKETGLGRSTVKRAVAHVERLGWLRRTQRPASYGDSDTNLYRVNAQGVGPRWTDAGSLRTAGRTTVDRPVGSERAGGRSAAGPNQVHPTSEEEVCARERVANAPAAHTGSDSFAKNRAAAWDFIVDRHQQARLDAYETRGSRERVRAEDRDEILDVLSRLAEDAITTWRTAFPQTPSGFDDAFRVTVGHVLVKWISEHEGHDGFLRNKLHPLYALRHDLSELELEWTEHWAAEVKKAQQEAVKGRQKAA